MTAELQRDTLRDDLRDALRDDLRDALRDDLRDALRDDLDADPAVRAAAVALQLGWSDPLALLRMDADDWTIAVAILDRAAADRAERDRHRLDALGVAVQNAVVRAFGGGDAGRPPGGWDPAWYDP